MDHQHVSLNLNLNDAKIGNGHQEIMVVYGKGRHQYMYVHGCERHQMF